MTARGRRWRDGKAWVEGSNFIAPCSEGAGAWGCLARSALCALQEAAILPGTAAQGVLIFSQRMAKIIRYAAFLTTTEGELRAPCVVEA